MHDVVDILLFRTWWAYDPNSSELGVVYRWFNLFEGSTWFVFAALVLRRYVRHRNSPIELLYSLDFATFGLSDFREAYALQSWLILFKCVNLGILLYLRWIVIQRYYPGSKMY